MEVLGPIQTQLRTFRAMAVLTETENGLKDVDKNGEIVCRVEHCSLLEPIERVWTNSHFGKAGSNVICHEAMTLISFLINIRQDSYWLISSSLILYHIIRQKQIIKVIKVLHTSDHHT